MDDIATSIIIIGYKRYILKDTLEELHFYHWLLEQFYRNRDDGTPPHVKREVHEDLNNAFPNTAKLTYKLACPLPRFNAMQFFMSYYLRQRIENACETIRGHQDVISVSCKVSWVRQARLRIDRHKFEQFLFEKRNLFY